MLTIHWLWIPVLVFVIFSFLTGLFNGFRDGIPENMASFVCLVIAALAFMVGIPIYIIAGILWVVHHINITS